MANYSGKMEVEGEASYSGNTAKVKGKGSFEASTEHIAEELAPSTASSMTGAMRSASDMLKEHNTNIKKYQR